MRSLFRNKLEWRSFKIRVVAIAVWGCWECDCLKSGGCVRSPFRNKLGERAFKIRGVVSDRLKLKLRWLCAIAKRSVGIV